VLATAQTEGFSKGMVALSISRWVALGFTSHWGQRAQVIVRDR